MSTEQRSSFASTDGRFRWVCSNGCGECAVKRIEFEHSRSETMEGRLIESKTIPRLVSACCEYDLMLWDDQKDEQVDVEISRHG